jgi:hypothetical protein
MIISGHRFSINHDRHVTNVSLFFGKEDFFAVLTRDLAQLLYFFVTMAGLFNFSTKTLLYQGISFDQLAIFLVAVSCEFMSITIFANIFNYWMIGIIDIIANGFASLCIALVFTVWAKEKNM